MDTVPTGCDIPDVLEHLARSWIEAHGVPPLDGGPSTTWAAPFLALCEGAFWGAAEAVHADEDRNFLEPPPAVGCHVYRLWASDGRLVYVGSTCALERRLRRHRDRWGAAIWTHATWVEFPDHASMLAGERHAIATEYPALNVAMV